MSIRNLKIPSFSRPATVSDSVTRPTNTTAYAVGDAIADSTSAPTAQALSGCASLPHGWGKIIKATLFDSANQSTKLQADVFLFNVAPGLDNDNAAFTPTDAELTGSLVGVLHFYDKQTTLNGSDLPTDAVNDSAVVGDAASGEGGNCLFVCDNLELLFRCAESSKDLWWVLVARNTYTPVSAETFTLKLDIMQDR